MLPRKYIITKHSTYKEKEKQEYSIECQHLNTVWSIYQAHDVNVHLLGLNTKYAEYEIHKACISSYLDDIKSCPWPN